MKDYHDHQRGFIERHAVIEMSSCKGCGVCTSACPSAAITLHGYAEEQIYAQIAALTA